MATIDEVIKSLEMVRGDAMAEDQQRNGWAIRNVDCAVMKLEPRNDNHFKAKRLLKKIYKNNTLGNNASSRWENTRTYKYDRVSLYSDVGKVIELLK